MQEEIYEITVIPKKVQSIRESEAEKRRSGLSIQDVVIIVGTREVQ
jgi:hypothetical protein